MGKATGFLELDRKVESYRDVDIRINDYDEIFSVDHNLINYKSKAHVVWIAVYLFASP